MHQILRIAKENLSIFHSLAEAERWIASATSTRPNDQTT
jgi:hypothetical protein